MDYHTPTLELAALARDAGVKRLVLTHLIPPIPDEGPLVEQLHRRHERYLHRRASSPGRDLQRIAVG